MYTYGLTNSTLWHRFVDIFVFAVFLRQKTYSMTSTPSTDTSRGGAGVATRAYVARKTPLYDHCALYAPDGQLLCTCDRKKAQWYIDKGLGGQFTRLTSGRGLGEGGSVVACVEPIRSVDGSWFEPRSSY